MPQKVTVIGDGGWGTALAIVLAHNGHDVTVWGHDAAHVAEIETTHQNTRFLPGVTIPSSIKWTTDSAACCRKASIVVLVVPSHYYGDVCAQLAPHLPASATIVSATKGLDAQSGERMSEVAAKIFPHNRHIAALSGPSHAEEVARFIPTAITVACPEQKQAQLLQQTFASRALRIYTSNDIVGVELGGALKNIIAIAAGASDGIGFGDNTKAALITRGLAEITRLGVALGAQPETFSGLSGLGDLVVTCTSQHSRNRGFGARLGRGETLANIQQTMEQVAEGVWTCPTARRLAQKLGVAVPIIDEVYAVLYEGKAPLAAVSDLMGRELGSE